MRDPSRRFQEAYQLIPKDHNANYTWATSPLCQTFLKVHKTTLIHTGIVKFLSSAVQFLPPLLISRLLRTLEAPGFTAAASYRLALSLAVVLLAKTGLENYYFFRLHKLGMEVWF